MKKTFALLILISTLSIVSFGQSSKDVSVAEVISKISRQQIMSYISELEGFGTRFVLAPNRFEVASWLKAQFEEMGFTDVVLDSFQIHTEITLPYTNRRVDTTTTQVNVIATLRGTETPEEIFITCGHYDCFSQNSDQFLLAPGADDNASGTTAVLETARAVMESDFQPKCTLKFICFAAEELMNFGGSGSETYAAQASARGDDIKLIVNNDMVGNNSDYIINSIIGLGHPDNFPNVAMLFDLARNNCAINVERQGYIGADLRGFINHGYDGVYFEETNFSPFYHTYNDISSNIDQLFITESIKASCAVLVGMGRYLTDVEEEAPPTSFVLLQNYPNPFNPGTLIQYTVPETEHIKLKVYNTLGEVVDVLVDETKTPGTHKVYFERNNLSSGVYLYTLETGNSRVSRKMIVLK